MNSNAWDAQRSMKKSGVSGSLPPASAGKDIYLFLMPSAISFEKLNQTLLMSLLFHMNSYTWDAQRSMKKSGVSGSLPPASVGKDIFFLMPSAISFEKLNQTLPMSLLFHMGHHQNLHEIQRFFQSVI